MWASTAKLERTSSSPILSADWKEASDGSGGWLATGGGTGTVGISWIDYPTRDNEEKKDDSRAYVVGSEEGSLYKSHFILRGHIGEVQLVRWKPNGIRLASYDSWGRIILWSNRANILAFEFQMSSAVLITDMQWSPCGCYIIACAKNGHIMSYSAVTGMNLFSVQIEATSCHINKAKLTCCSWNKPGTRVAFGTSNGEVILLNPADNGRSLMTITISQGVPIQKVAWYGPIMPCQQGNHPPYRSQGFFTYLRNGDCVFFQTPGCSECVYNKTGVLNGRAMWNSDESILAVIGYSCSHRNLNATAQFLNHNGYFMFTVEDLPIPPRLQFPVQNVLWCLRDSTIVLSCGPHVYTLKVDHSLPSLETLCRHAIISKIVSEGEDAQINMLPLPTREINQLTRIKEPLILNPFDTRRLDILTCLHKPVPSNHRLHCMLEPTGNGFLLKLEHFNLYLPLLQARKKPGKRTSVQSSYIIEPAFDCTPPLEGNEEEEWTKSLSSCSLGPGKTDIRSRPSFLRRVFSGFNPLQGVTDTIPTSRATLFNSNQVKVVLAELEGNSFANRFRFQTSSLLFPNGSLGSVNINTNYIKCKPRSVFVVLPTAGRLEAEQVLVSKDPEWNDAFQIYELDFGGRVNRDSIKNFQIEHNEQVVLQFGKAGPRQFCLDFQAPFSPVQATCLALSSIL